MSWILTFLTSVLGEALKGLLTDFLNRIRLKKATRNEIENDALKAGNQKVRDLRDTLSEPIDIDGLPDDFWDDDGAGAVNAAVRFPDRATSQSQPSSTRLANTSD